MKKPRNSSRDEDEPQLLQSHRQLLSDQLARQYANDSGATSSSSGRRGRGGFGVVFQRSFDDVALEQAEPDDREHARRAG